MTVKAGMRLFSDKLIWFLRFDISARQLPYLAVWVT